MSRGNQKMCQRAKNDVSMPNVSKLRADSTDTYTDRHTDRQTRPNALQSAFADGNKNLS